MAAISYHLSCLTANERRQMEKGRLAINTKDEEETEKSQDRQKIDRRVTEGQMLGETEKTAVTRESERWRLNCCELVFHTDLSLTILDILKTGDSLNICRVNIHCAPRLN